MPQPINRIRSNPIIDFDPVKLQTVPHLTALPMTVIAIWASIDGILGKMLSNLIKTSDLGAAVSMFHAIKNQDTQREAIKAAAKKTLPPEDYTLFDAILTVTKTSRQRRHDYAHHIWGVPENIPDSLALLDPKDSLREIVIFEERMEEWRNRMGTFNRSHSAYYHRPMMYQNGIENTLIPPSPPANPSDSPDFSNVQCFRTTDLENDVKDAEKALVLFLTLQRALFGQPPQAKDAARRQLLSEPQIQQLLQLQSA